MSARDWPRLAILSRKALSECAAYLSTDEWVFYMSSLGTSLYFMRQYSDALATADRCVAQVPRADDCLTTQKMAREALESLSQKRGTPPGVHKVSENLISITGSITEATRKDFTALEPTEGRRTLFLYLDSQGGSLSAAMAIGDIVRNHAFNTIVGAYDECSSACVFILAAGVQRRPFASAKIGIHRPSFNDESDFGSLTQKQGVVEYNKLIDEARSYLHRMGMGDDLFPAMLRVPSGQVRYLSNEDIRAFGLEGEDPAWAEWFKAQWIAKEGRVNYEIDQSFFTILKACTDSGLDATRCDQEIRTKLWGDVDECAKTSGRDRIICAREIESRMVGRYAR